jgi:hypothetical protein
METDVQQFGLFHHNQERSDAELDQLVDDCRRIVKSENKSLRCFAAHAGMEINL